MPKSDFIQPNDEAFAAQLITFKNAIGGYATLLGVSPAQVTAQAADAVYMEFVLECLDLMRNGSKQWTGWKDLVRDGGTPPATGMPMVPAFPTTVTAVGLGIEVRFRALVKDIKGTPITTSRSGWRSHRRRYPGRPGSLHAPARPQARRERWHGEHPLGLAGQQRLPRPDRAASGPRHRLRPPRHGHRPGYTDTFGPTAAAKWTYRGIYRVGDNRVGQWSNEVSINVAP